MTSPLPLAIYEELVTHLIDMVTVVDESGVVLYESPSIEESLGYTPEELVGEQVFDYIHPDDQQAAIETFYRVTVADERYSTGSLEIRFRHKDGSWVWLETRGSNRSAELVDGYVLISRDITKRKRSEQQLEQERDRLERFVGILSHDLRNPLNVAQGRLVLAQEESDPVHLEIIQRSLDRIEELVEDVLVLAREGWQPPQLDAVDLRTAVEACWETVDTADATLSVDAEVVFLADEQQLRHLLENLIRNAIDHGGSDVTLSVGALDDGFYVADDGHGLPDCDPAGLFEFGRTTKPEGTGLGLSIVLEIVENHGWSVSLRNGEDGGARFEIREVELLPVDELTESIRTS